MQISTQDIKTMLIEVFSLEQKVEDINDDSAIIGEGLGLDSVDALEIIAQINRRFGLKIKGQTVRPEHFKNIKNLTDFVNESLNSTGVVKP